MGAWGHKSFENDSVLDWFAGVESNPTLVGEVLQAVASADSDQDVTTNRACAALAAAEFVAAALGKGDDRLSRSVAPWLEQHRAEVAELGAPLARAAAQRVFENSELRDLWDENGGENEWHADVRELIRRLQ
jgi:hypothetical protein